MNSKEEIAIGSFGEPIIGKIRILEEIMPISSKFKTAKKVTAATGIIIQLSEPQEIMPGIPFQAYHGNKADIVKEFKKLITEKIQVDDDGIVIKLILLEV